jgi:DNA repair exonuclease SbcCD ATPase subunit
MISGTLWVRRLFSLVTLTLIAGCAVTPEACDPKQGGFVHSVGCLGSGAYGKRQEALEARLTHEHELNQAFRKLLASIEEEERRTKETLARKQAEYEEIDQAWKALSQLLQQRSQQNQQLAEQVQGMEQRIAQLKRSEDQTTRRKKQQQLEDLRRQVSSLQRELEAGMY